jgi:cytochrome c oxidase assembly protein subunit 11
MSDAQTSQAASGRGAAKKRRNTRTAVLAASIVVFMIGMSFAAVPLYKVFCQVTGYGGTTQRTADLPDEMLDRIVIVQFDSNVASTLGWEFEPVQRRVHVHIGEPTEIAYRATNLTGHATVGTAVFNVTPETVGAYFMKVQCFCFTQQALGPGESVEMPVLFYIDPSIADDPNLDYVDTITLSYTFYPAVGAEPAPVAQTATAGGGLN